MSYFELFQESPGLFFVVLVLSLVVTLLVYGAFPIIFARARKKPITKKKYKTLCYGVNIIGIVFFVAINGSAVSGGPYLLWTWIFSNHGLKKLEEKGLLADIIQPETDVAETPLTVDKICFCRRCGTPLEDGSKFCRKCGTEIKEEEQ